MKLTAENVSTIFRSCLFLEGEKTDSAIIAKGIQITVGLNPERVKENSDNISNLLSQIPKSFRKEDGGGYSFLALCTDSNEEQWTGLQKIMDELLMLGLATGELSYALPRELWACFPGSMPYIILDLKKPK